MSKIICEICGTVYPDNATVCPICGYPRQDTEKVVTEEASAGTAAAPAAAKPVKGGRFSSKNVKKRNQTGTTVEKRTDHAPETPEKGGPGKAVIVAVACLTVAAILLTGYIGFRFFAGASAYDAPKETKAPEQTTAAPTTETTQLQETEVACYGMVVSDTSIQFKSAGRAWLLDVTVQPEDTTDPIIFESSDESIATVSADGRVAAVAPGTAVITITCGEVSKQCIVVCDFEAETTPVETTEETTEATTEPKTNSDGFKLDRSDVTLFTKGESFTFDCTNNGSYLSNSQVTWSSSNEAVAKVENGKVTAAGSGMCTISATYGGKTDKCIVRCSFKDEDAKPTETTEASSSDSSWSISDTDVTISVGESFSLKITNNSGETASVSWSSGDSSIASVSGSTVTGQASGMTTVSAAVDGQTFSCTVRVK